MKLANISLGFFKDDTNEHLLFIGPWIKELEQNVFKMP